MKIGSFIDKIVEHIVHPRRGYAYVYARLWRCAYGRRTSDEKYLKKKFKWRLGYELNLNNPQTFNEKLQWLKLYDQNPIYATMVDKYLVKKYVADRIGERYVIPLLGVWERFDDIDFDELPNQFVLKTTHDCGGVVVVKDKKSFDQASAKRFVEKHLKNDYFWHCREWPYKQVKPRIIAEQFMKDGESDFLPVYKFFCFDGEPRIIQVIQNDKQPNETIDYFDADWNLLRLRQNFPNSERPLPRPEKLEEMLTIARKLAAEKKSFIRVDLYTIGGAVYFSEYTMFSDAGFAAFEPKDWDRKLGEWLALPQETIR